MTATDQTPTVEWQQRNANKTEKEHRTPMAGLDVEADAATGVVVVVVESTQESPYH